MLTWQARCEFYSSKGHHGSCRPSRSLSRRTRRLFHLKCPFFSAESSPGRTCDRICRDLPIDILETKMILCTLYTPQDWTERQRPEVCLHHAPRRSPITRHIEPPSMCSTFDPLRLPARCSGARIYPSHVHAMLLARLALQQSCRESRTLNSR